MGKMKAASDFRRTLGERQKFIFSPSDSLSIIEREKSPASASKNLVSTTNLSHEIVCDIFFFTLHIFNFPHPHPLPPHNPPALLHWPPYTQHTVAEMRCEIFSRVSAPSTVTSSYPWPREVETSGDCIIKCATLALDTLILWVFREWNNSTRLLWRSDVALRWRCFPEPRGNANKKKQKWGKRKKILQNEIHYAVIA